MIAATGGWTKRNAKKKTTVEVEFNDDPTVLYAFPIAFSTKSLGPISVTAPDLLSPLQLVIVNKFSNLPHRRFPRQPIIFRPPEQPATM